MAATKRDFAINYGLKTDFTGNSAGSTLFVDQSGDKVGIGTDIPSDKLEVKGTSGAGVIVISSGDTTLLGGDVIGQINFKDYDADSHNSGDQDDYVNIKAIAKHESADGSAFDGSEGEGYDLTFSTSKRIAGADQPFVVSEKLRITSTGEVKANGSFQESTDGGTTYWNVVTQQDVGTAANQVPLNQYLGQLAFLDDFSPNGLRRSGGSSDDVSIDSDGIVTFNGTGSLVIPSGTTTQQTPITTGAIRFNTTITSFEGYNGSNWGKIGGGANVSTTAPFAGIVNGDLWYDSEGGRLYVYYSDGDSDQWVDASPFGIPTAITRFANNVGIGAVNPTDHLEILHTMERD